MRLLVAAVRSCPETFLERLILGLSKAGVEVGVGCPSEPQELLRRSPRVHWVPMPSWSGGVARRLLRLSSVVAAAVSRTPRASTRALIKMRNEGSFQAGAICANRVFPLIGRPYDVVYFPWLLAAGVLPEWYQLSQPVVVSCRGSQVLVGPHGEDSCRVRAALERAFDRSNVVHCVSEAIKREAVALGLDPAKASVIRPAVDPEVFSPPPSRSAQEAVFRLVMTGSLIWRKGYEYALLALRKLLDEGVPARLRIIGDGRERQRVVYTIQDLGLDREVDLLGRLPVEGVRNELRSADAFVLASLAEGISNAALEAMACGLPVVTTDCGGMREAVDDGVEGFVVPTREPEAMAVALVRMAEDPAFRQQLGAAARARIVREFGLERQISQWIELFDSVVVPGKNSKAVS